MKLRCTRTKHDGWLGKPTSVLGLTVGKVYSAEAVPYSTPITGSVSEDTFSFLVYNDDAKWVLYPLVLFEPAD